MLENLGNPTFRAPELVHQVSEECVDVSKSEVWSIGLIGLYMILKKDVFDLPNINFSIDNVKDEDLEGIIFHKDFPKKYRRIGKFIVKYFLKRNSKERLSPDNAFRFLQVFLFGPWKKIQYKEWEEVMKYQNDDLAIKYLHFYVKNREKVKHILKMLLLDDLEIPHEDIIHCMDDEEKRECLGQGTFGAVYKCALKREKKVDLPVAIKYISCDVDISKVIKQVRTELSIACDLSHPNVIKVYGFVKAPIIFSGNKFTFGIVMELMGEGSLKQFIDSRKVSWKEKWILIKEAIRSVDYLHLQTPNKCTIIHRFLVFLNLMVFRDIKPWNFLLTDDRKSLKISDFGMCQTKGFSKSSTRGIEKGSGRFIAPEIFGSDDEEYEGESDEGESKMEKEPDYSPKSDIFSLGMTIYFIVEGKLPFHKCVKEIVAIQRILTGKKPRLSKQTPEILKKIVRKCILIDPKRRPTAGELLTFMKENEEKFLEEYGK